jgi:2'-5' RNA ligase
VRLFIAVDPDAPARTAIAASVGRLREGANRREPDLSRSVAWVDAPKLHLTLHFLGEVDDRRVPLLQSSLACPIGIEPPEVGFGGWGMFPAHGPPRVVWIGITAGLPSLERAHAILEARLAALGVGVEGRRFSPHLTVGRVKAPAAGHLRDLLADPDVSVAAQCAVTRCTLYRSRLSPRGSTYEALVHTPFQP